MNIIWINEDIMRHCPEFPRWLLQNQHTYLFYSWKTKRQFFFYFGILLSEENSINDLLGVIWTQNSFVLSAGRAGTALVSEPFLKLVSIVGQHLQF